MTCAGGKPSQWGPVIHHRAWVVDPHTRRRVRSQVSRPKSAVDAGTGGTGVSPATAKFCLTFPREPLSVPVTRHVLGGILYSVGLADDSVSDLLLAATEACSNVLRHGGPRVTGYAVVVTIGA